MSQFGSAKRLCCWAGLTPGNNQSAGKKKSSKITKAGVYIKPALVEAAHGAVSCKSNPYYKQKFERISKRRGKKRAYIAIARMILTAIYHILLTGELLNPTDLKKSDNFAAEREETIIKRAIKLLEKQGYAVQPPVSVP